MLRIVAAVLAGYVAIGVLVVATDQVAAMSIPGFGTMTRPPTYYFVGSLLTDFIWTIAGGYICSWIARDAWRTARIGLIVFGELMGLAAVIAFWKIQPHWYAFGLMLTFPPAVWLGARVRTRTA